MLLNSVIIILREVLEAALLISLMLSLSHYFKVPLSWLKWSFIAGLLGAFLYAHYIVPISAWFDGVGQEVFNASMQYLVYILLAGFCIWLICKPSMSTLSLKIAAWIMAISVSLAMTREFSEILIYIQVFSPGQAHFNSIMIGAFLGTGIGLSIGIIFYSILNFLNERFSSNSTILILAFIASGMLLQATQLLIQADWLPSRQPLWNSSAWISENSVAGQLLYAVFGYEASPSLIEVSIYLAGLLIILFFILRRYRLDHFKNPIDDNKLTNDTF